MCCSISFYISAASCQQRGVVHAADSHLLNVKQKKSAGRQAGGSSKDFCLVAFRDSNHLYSHAKAVGKQW